jgi:hypothetical protein
LWAAPSPGACSSGGRKALHRIGHRQSDASGGGDQSGADGTTGRRVHPWRPEIGQRHRGLPACDWVIDAAANPSVLAGLSGTGAAAGCFEHNLGSLGNVLEYCKEHKAGLCLLSSSRVYSIPALAAIPLRVHNRAFTIDAGGAIAARTDAKRDRRGVLHQPRRFLSMARPSWRRRSWRWNMAPHSISRCGSLAAECSPAPGSSARRTRASSRIG